MEGFSDARRGFIYQRLRQNLHNLAKMSVHPKNWRPTILLFSHNPSTRICMAKIANWINADRGITTIAQIVIGDLHDPIVTKERNHQEKDLLSFIQENKIAAFPEVVILQDFDQDVGVFIQAHSIGPIKPNIALMGWARSSNRCHPYFQHLRSVQQLGKSIVIASNPEALHDTGKLTRIDCWWRGKQNGSLMVVLAHLMQQHPDWRGSTLRLLRYIPNAKEEVAARQDLEEIIEAGRIKATIETPVSNADFATVLREHSSDASIVMLGFVPPTPELEDQMQANTTKLIDGLPPTLLVYSAGDADLLA
jgi:hypothetical protein